jgi:dTDP-4-dehydrorhamnose 3,5-epimerase-like enzyme
MAEDFIWWIAAAEQEQGVAQNVIVEQLRRAVDTRGQVFEPLDALGLSAQRNVHVVTTRPQQIRGNHFHHNGTEVTAVVGPARVRYRRPEVTAVVGPARVRYRQDAEIITVDVPADEVWRFVFPPRVTHAFQNTGAGSMLVVSFNTETHDPQNPDTTRDVIL